MLIVHYGTLQYVIVHMLQYVTVCYGTLQYVIVRILQYVIVRYSTYVLCITPCDCIVSVTVLGSLSLSGGWSLPLQLVCLLFLLSSLWVHSTKLSQICNLRKPYTPGKGARWHAGDIWKWHAHSVCMTLRMCDRWDRNECNQAWHHDKTVTVMTAREW